VIAFAAARRTLRARLSACGACVVLFVAAAQCWAHAVVVEATPAMGAAVRTAPDRVVLRFNVRIEHALARATLKSGDAPLVTLTPLQDGAAQSDRLVIPLPALGPGEHELRYRVLATDGHTTLGVLRFRVMP
jgi:methionine-rich copper-binding protein CopC